MSEDRNLRTAILAITALAAAVGAGFLIGRTGEEAPASPRVAAEAAAEAATDTAASAGTRAAAQSPASAPRASATGASQPAPSAREAKGSWWESKTSSEPPAPPAERVVVVPAGTRVAFRLVSGVSSQTAAVGDAVRAQVAEAVVVDGVTAIPAGAEVRGRVTEARPLRRIGGKALLAIELEQVTVAGSTVPIQAAFAREGKSETGKDAATIAAGAAVGTVLGNQAKHNDRGKIVGGLIGAGVGTAIAASTPGETVELGAGATLRLTLRADAEVRVPAG